MFASYMRKKKYLCSLKKKSKMKRRLITKAFAALIVALAPTMSMKSPAQTAATPPPCPDVKINEKYDHNSYYTNAGWDTVVNCQNNGVIELSVEPYIPTQYFNGTYRVETIPYNPPDTTFALGTRMPIGTDDVFASNHTTIPYPFYFFGIRKTQFRIGANGLVTFCSPADFGSGDYCPYGYRSSNNQLPWNGTTNHTAPGGTSYGSRMYDAIYGVYEDTHPGHFTGSDANRVDGIFYGIQDEYPCRKIICSWKEAPNFGDYSHHGTYQIVCYEGSNIIEVHVKQKRCCPSTSDALIGIQNADGQPQVKGAIGEPNMYVVNGSPAAFWPNGYNGFTNDVDTVAFRFTPLGSTSRSLEWYRIFDDGRDSIMLTTNVNDPNGYFTPMHDMPNNPDYDPVHPTLSTAVVKVNEPARFVVCLRFQNANEDWYILRDTISIGIDTAKSLKLKSITPQPDTSRRLDICNGQTAALQLHFTAAVDTLNWRVERILGGRRFILPTSMYELQDNERTIVIKPDPRYDTLPRNHIDSIRVLAVAYFSNSCNNFDTFLVRVYPVFDTVNEAGICNGQEYYWPADGNRYTANTTQPVARLQSAPGCDSTVHLHLTVYDVSYNIDHQETCRDFTWRNGRTYTESNWATAAADTVRLQNRYGCDSIVQLELVVNPLKARIQSDVEEFTYDNMEAMLNDISTGGNSRVWLLPVGKDANGDTIMRESSEAMVYYTIPDSISEANIWLIAASPYGCLDTAHLFLPMHKETMYVPTAFMPDNPEGNNIFRSQSLNTVMQEMWIYDRQGRVMAHCTGVDCGWDGRDLNGNPCQQGAYVYIINYTTTHNPRQTQSMHGTVTLIR